MSKGKRGAGKDHLLLWEEIPFLRVEPTGKPVAIYKREDAQSHLPVEERNYYAHFPIRGTRGKRKSLLVSSRDQAVMRAQEQVVALQVQLAQGVTVVKTTVETVVEQFLRHKASRVRDGSQGKDAGRKTITQERYGLIKGKLRNYLIPFLGSKTDAQSVKPSKWKTWEAWRIENSVRGRNPRTTRSLTRWETSRSVGTGRWKQVSFPHHRFLFTGRTSRLTTREGAIRGNHRSGIPLRASCPSG